ncbi:MAG: succinylglutamate desuccinylase/aspartoacylase family protein [Proteobacteria bacterium]|nr:succinylglutamate desuccinylase/aspartoacylase family protein [Pseudomonadota bacterium]
MTNDNNKLSHDYFTRVKGELDRFSELVTLVTSIYGGSQLGTDIYLLGAPESLPNIKAKDPATPLIASLNQKIYPLVISAIIHGNEIAGLTSMNRFLESLALHETILDYPIIVLLGNRKAALAGVRFIDADLNRSFALKGDERVKGCHEHARAGELEQHLKKAAFLLDIHQTIGQCSKGFFIFSYSKRSYHFARKILPYQDIVTYWPGPFTTEGICSDQFIEAHGGIGLTLELGSKGFHPYQAALGWQAMIGAQGYVRRYLLQQAPLDTPYHQALTPGPIFSPKAVVKYPQKGDVIPISPPDNFSEVYQGQKLAHSSEFGDIVSPTSGLALFASFHQAKASERKRPHELLRILKLTHPSELPKK